MSTPPTMTRERPGATGGRPAPEIRRDRRLPPRPPRGPALGRSSESVLCLLAGGMFVTGAWAASAYHLRIFSSPFPLWIVLAANGAIALTLGVAAWFVRDAPPPDAEGDEDLVRVPRALWESVQSRARAGGSPTRPPRGGWVARPAHSAVPPIARGASSGTRAGVPAPRTTSRGSLRAPRASLRRRELGRIEFYGSADCDLFAGENSGNPDP
jgi:hypothetical protein